jgi:hypothetical protein
MISDLDLVEDCWVVDTRPPPYSGAHRRPGSGSSSIADDASEFGHESEWSARKTMQFGPAKRHLPRAASAIKGHMIDSFWTCSKRRVGYSELNVEAT